MKKLTISLITCVLLFAAFLPFSVSADMVPEESVVVDFIGLEDRTYYATLLMDKESSTPYEVYEGSDDVYRGDEQDVYIKFKNYKVEDGYHILRLSEYENCTDSHRFTCIFYPPGKFKVLIYFADTDEFVVSERAYEKYAYHSYFTANLSKGVSDFTVIRSYKYLDELAGLIMRVVLTVLLELLVAIVFGFRKRKQVIFILIVNVITQIGLNIMLTFISIYMAPMSYVLIYIILELLVIIIEALLYLWLFFNLAPSVEPISKGRVITYAVVANAVSFILGILLANVIPFIF